MFENNIDMNDPQWRDEFGKLYKDFEKEALANQDVDAEKWMSDALKRHLPNLSDDEIQTFVKDAKKAQQITKNQKESLTEAMANGRSKYNWFASRIDSVASGASVGPTMACGYLNNLNTTLNNANKSMAQTVLNQAGTVSKNPNLHGFIFEQHHVETLNMSQTARMDPNFAARVPDASHGYSHHGVDIAVDNIDAGQKFAQKYQAKDCKTPSATNQALHADGGYRGQKALVPDGQESSIKNSVNQIETPSGASSNPISYERSKQIQEEAQSGNFDNIMNWNEYKMRDLAVGTAKSAACAGVLGAGMSAGMEIVSKLANGEQVEAEDVAKAAVKGGATAAMLDATTCAIKVGVEKDIITFIPKGTPAATIANVAFVAVEDIKILSEIADGELDLKEGLEEIEATTISAISGLAVAEGVGAAVGAACGGGVIGMAAGAVVGAVAYTATATVCKAVIKGAQMVRDVACDALCAVAEGIGSVASSVCDFVGDVWDTVTGSCYITTAICKELNRPDDCYELTTLRNYRDNWLSQQLGGKELIKEYYKTAPQIVEFIKKMPNYKYIYQKINDEYLSKCIAFIEKKMFNQCKQKYIDMVKYLESLKMCYINLQETLY